MLRRLTFNLWYFRRPPWDTGVSPPELKEFIENHPPGRALDIGCGTGTNVITLARAGWQATGIDFVPRAIMLAKQKAQKAGASVDLRVGDATKLDGIEGPFELVLDMGCFHSLGAVKANYLGALDRVLAPGGYWLMYGFFNPSPDQAGPGLVEADLDRIQARFTLRSRQDGTERGHRPSAWFLFRKVNNL